MARAFLALAALAVLVVAAPQARAVLPHERLADPALESRAREISRELRCQVCQNQSIADSNAPLAADLRRLVRERLLAGDDDARVLAHVVARYGDYVRLTPPLRADTAMLWATPAIVLCAALAAIALRLRRRRAAPLAAKPLDAGEQAALRELLRDGEAGSRAGRGGR
ncbi:MAG: cytochrome c-type biogenesis protein [Alphaproteobacteria bacterium]